MTGSDPASAPARAREARELLVRSNGRSRRRGPPSLMRVSGEPDISAPSALQVWEGANSPRESPTSTGRMFPDEAAVPLPSDLADFYPCFAHSFTLILKAVARSDRLLIYQFR